MALVDITNCDDSMSDQLIIFTGVILTDDGDGRIADHCCIFSSMDREFNRLSGTINCSNDKTICVDFISAKLLNSDLCVV